MVGDVLQCNIQIITYIGFLTHNIEKFQGKIIRISIMKANPFYPFNISHFTDKIGYFNFTIEIKAIIS